MIIKAKVSLSSIRNFIANVQEIAELKKYAESCSQSIQCLKKGITEKIQQYHQCLDTFNKAQNLIRNKECTFTNKLNTLTKSIESLQIQLAAAESELQSTPKTYTTTTSEGNAIENLNSAWQQLSDRVDALRRQISELQDQVSKYQYKIWHIQSLNARIDTQVSSVTALCSDLQEDDRNADILLTELNDLFEDIMRKNTSANDTLKKIQSLILKYLSVQISVENTAANNQNPVMAPSEFINTNTTAQDTKSKQDTVQASHIKIDDNGKEYRLGDELLPNNTFQINGYTYETDAQSRTISASGKLSLNELGQRNRTMSDSKSVIGKGDELECDDRGHLIAHQFNGSDEMENMIPQNANINRSCFRAHEEFLASQLKAGHTVEVNVIPFYGGDSRRPTALYYFYKIDDTYNMKLFPNHAEERSNE